MKAESYEVERPMHNYRVPMKCTYVCFIPSVRNGYLVHVLDAQIRTRTKCCGEMNDSNWFFYLLIRELCSQHLSRRNLNNITFN